MNITHIQFHIGDFLSGVMHMDGAEVGAYTMLIMAHYQAGEQGIPDDDKKLRQICKITSRSWKTVKETVLDKFYLEGGFWKHERVITELQKIAQKRQEKAGTGRPKTTTECHSRETLNDVQKSIKGYTKKNKPLKNKETEKTKPITYNHLEKEKNKTKKKKDFEEEFENSFWPKAVKKKAKGAARKAYIAARAKAEEGEILKAWSVHNARWQQKKGTDDWEFVPHPASWLNQERWEDEESLPDPEPMTEWPAWKHSLASRIGEHNVKSWFNGAHLNGERITVARRFQAEKIKNEFMIDIENSLGKQYQIEVRQ